MTSLRCERLKLKVKLFFFYYYYMLSDSVSFIHMDYLCSIFVLLWCKEFPRVLRIWHRIVLELSDWSSRDTPFSWSQCGQKFMDTPVHSDSLLNIDLDAVTYWWLRSWAMSARAEVTQVVRSFISCGLNEMIGYLLHTCDSQKHQIVLCVCVCVYLIIDLLIAVEM